MKRIIAILLTVIILPAMYAQEPAKYALQLGRITQHEATMTEYEADKDAEAFVVFEKGRNYFTRAEDSPGGFDLYMEHYAKIKILKQAGIKYGEIEIPYYVDSDGTQEQIYNLVAYTYNYEDNQMTKVPLDPKNIYDEKLSENWRVKKFAMPNVREGSIIEFQYTIITSFYFNMREWVFQRKIPVMHSELELKSIPYYQYVYILKGAKEFDDLIVGKAMEINLGRLKYREAISTFIMRDLPAFKDEEFITSENDYLVSLNFQLSKYKAPAGSTKDVMSTWPLLCERFLSDEQFGKYIKAAEKEGKIILPSLNLSGQTPIEQMKTVERYVKQNYNWNGYNDKYTSGKVSNFLKQKTGNSADINLFLVGLLNAAGIQANPVVLSTRSHGTVYVDYPFSNFLNYVIVQASIGEETYLLDATESMLYFDQLPERCTNVIGLVVKPKSNEWINIYQSYLALTQKTFEIRIDESLEKLQTDVLVRSYAANAYQYRAIYRDKEENLRKYLRDKDVDLSGEIKVRNYSEVSEPFEFMYKTEQSVEKSENELFIAPFLNQSVTKNIFNQNERKLPVDLVNVYAAKYSSVIEIPKGYKVSYLPKKIEHDGKVMEVAYNAVEEDGKIVVTAGYMFKESIYSARDYTFLKGTYGEMVKRFNELIVLVKE